MKIVEVTAKPWKCPVCGGKKIALILYGKPAMTEKLEEKLKMGRVVLGGCEVSANDPEYICKACDTYFRISPSLEAGV